MMIRRRYHVPGRPGSGAELPLDYDRAARRPFNTLAVEPPAFDEIREDLTALRAVHAGMRDRGMQSARPASQAYRRTEQVTIEQATI